MDDHVRVAPRTGSRHIDALRLLGRAPGSLTDDDAAVLGRDHAGDERHGQLVAEHPRMCRHAELGRGVTRELDRRGWKSSPARRSRHTSLRREGGAWSAGEFSAVPASGDPAATRFNHNAAKVRTPSRGHAAWQAFPRHAETACESPDRSYPFGREAAWGL